MQPSGSWVCARMQPEPARPLRMIESHAAVPSCSAACMDAPIPLNDVRDFYSGPSQHTVLVAMMKEFCGITRALLTSPAWLICCTTCTLPAAAPKPPT